MVLHDTSFGKQLKDKAGKVPEEGATKYTHSSVNTERRKTYSLSTRNNSIKIFRENPLLQGTVENFCQCGTSYFSIILN